MLWFAVPRDSPCPHFPYSESYITWNTMAHRKGVYLLLKATVKNNEHIYCFLYFTDLFTPVTESIKCWANPELSVIIGKKNTIQVGYTVIVNTTKIFIEDLNQWRSQENFQGGAKPYRRGGKNFEKSQIFTPKKLFHEFHEICHSVTFIVIVNSHQRWKQTRNRVCFHLWCELTLA